MGTNNAYLESTDAGKCFTDWMKCFKGQIVNG